MILSAVRTSPSDHHPDPVQLDARYQQPRAVIPTLLTASVGRKFMAVRSDTFVIHMVIRWEALQIIY